MNDPIGPECFRGSDEESHFMAQTRFRAGAPDVPEQPAPTPERRGDGALREEAGGMGAGGDSVAPTPEQPSPSAAPSADVEPRSGAGLPSGGDPSSAPSPSSGGSSAAGADDTPDHLWAALERARNAEWALTEQVERLTDERDDLRGQLAAAARTLAGLADVLVRLSTSPP